MCLAAADENRFVLGDKRPVHGDVLYLALEVIQRRLKKRLHKIIQGQGGSPPRLALHTEWKRFNEGGLADLAAVIVATPSRHLTFLTTTIGGPFAARTLLDGSGANVTRRGSRTALRTD